IGNAAAAEVLAPAIDLEDKTPEQLTLDADNVYWWTEYGSVASMAKAGSTNVTTYLEMGSGPPPRSIAVDETFVYWLQEGNSVYYALKGQGPTTPMLAGPTVNGYPSFVAIAVDCSAVFWTAIPGADPNHDGGTIPGSVRVAAKPTQ